MYRTRLIKVLKNPFLLIRFVRSFPARTSQWLEYVRYDIRKVLSPRHIVIQMKKFSMWIDMNDLTLGRYFFIHREYEPFETSVLESMIKAGMTVVDIGANIGYYTIMFGQKVGHNGKVYAFEPDINNFSLLKKNLELNHLQNVVCEHAAVMNQEGFIELFLSDINFGDHRSFQTNDDKVSNNSLQRNTVHVPAVVLDTYLGDTKVDLIKMDIQGAEMIALSGMLNVLKNPKIVVFCEFWPYGIVQSGHQPQSFLDTLNQIGFEFYEIDEIHKVIKVFDTTLTSTLLEESKSDFASHVNLICTRPERFDELGLGNS